MSYRRLIYAVGLILILSGSASAAGLKTDGYQNGGGLYSSYRSDKLFQLTERQGTLAVSEIGGTLGTRILRSATLNWRYVDRQFDYAEHGLKNSEFRISGRSGTTWLGVTIPLEKYAVIITQAGVNLRRAETQVMHDTRITLSPAPFADFDFRIGRNGDEFRIDGTFLGEAVMLPVATDWTFTGCKATFRIHPKLVVLTGYTDLALDDISDKQSGKYSSALSGAGENRYLKIVIGDFSRSFVMIGHDQYSGSGRMELYTGGTRFGQIAKLACRITRWRLETRPPYVPPNLVFSLERYSGSAEAAGNIQGWPFTDLLADLLGARRMFVAEAEGTLWRAAGYGEFHLSARTRLTGVLELFRLYPDLRFADWRPSYLVFGVDDLKMYHDSYRRIDFGRVRIEAGRQFGRINLGCTISQVFPIDVVKDTDSSAPSDDGGPEDPGLSAKSSRADGGRSIRLRLGYSF